jgi:DNA polymerase-3 subunit delta'
MSSLKTFSTQLCPWLRDTYESLTGAQLYGRLGHAWLLTGPAGVGKLNLALATANYLLERKAEQPRELSAADVALSMATLHDTADHHPDLHWVFPDQEKRTRSITVDQIRATVQALMLTSLHGQRKVVVIDPSDALTTSAANALLKTLEEPTNSTYLFLVSQQPGRLPATIRSRCQTLSVPHPAEDSALDWLEAQSGNATRDDWALLLALANGSPLYTLTLFAKNYIIKNSNLENNFNLIYNNELDPQTLADEWIKEGIELPLDWLTKRLQRVIYARMTAEVSSIVTDIGSDRLGNAWQALTLEGLFRRLDAAETLLRRLSSGTNADLALRALLMTFHPQRRQT